ncbi:MAG: glycerol-3-phosphate 1-O-acyltransferase PlsY [Kiritimatiellae bacterium]|nr:glycerol-3-phosphate 1-O-acyltransferase PlsY [Kiritimatiellia bacterium]
MNEAVTYCAWAIAAYLTGAIPFGFLIGKMRGIDVRTVGSRNIGATNVFRTVGKKWGLLAFACDFLKGFLPTLAASRFGGGAASLPLVVGVMCVVGHMLTLYMKFKGGKGVATAFGMLVALVPALVGVAFLVFVAFFAASHYISLGSCMAAAFLAAGVWFKWLGCAGTDDLPQAILVAAMALFVIWKHRSNIGRLIRGEENRIYIFGRQTKEKKK